MSKFNFISNLFKPPWQHSNWKVRLSEINNIDDEKILMKIVLDDKNDDVINAALKKFSQQGSLAKIVFEADNEDLQKKALNNIQDENILADISLKCRQPINVLAVEKINNHTILLDILKRVKIVTIFSPGSSVADSVLKKITDQNELFKIATYPISRNITVPAIEKITDAELLAKIVKSVDDMPLKIEAIKRIKREDIIFNLLESNDSMISYVVFEYSNLPEDKKEPFKLIEKIHNEQSFDIISDTSQKERIKKLIQYGTVYSPYIFTSIISTREANAEYVYKNNCLLCLALAKIGGNAAIKYLTEIATFDSKIYEYRYIRAGAVLGLIYISKTNGTQIDSLKKIKDKYGSLKNINDYLLFNNLGNDLLETKIDEFEY